MTSNKDDKNKTLKKEVSNEAIGTVYDFRSEKEKRKKEGGGFFKGVANIISGITGSVGGVLGKKEDKQEQNEREQTEKINEKRRMRQITSRALDYISYRFDENNNKYQTVINTICNKIKNSGVLSDELYKHFIKITKVIFVKPGIIDKEARQNWQKIIQNVTNSGVISQSEKNNLFWTGRLLQFYFTIKEKVEYDLDYLYNQIKIPKEILNNIVSDEIYKAIDEHFNFGEIIDRNTIQKEELLTKGKTTIIAAIHNIKKSFAELLIKRPPGDYLKYKTELDSNDVSKQAAQWGYIYYGSSLLSGERTELSQKGFINSKGPNIWVENFIKYIYVFVSPNEANKILQEITNMYLFKGVLNKNAVNILADFDKGGNIIKVVDFIDSNIKSLFQNGIPNNISCTGEKKERFTQTCSNLIFNYQKLKCEIMSGDPIIETLGKIITIYEQNDWDGEIDLIIGMFEKIRLNDTTKLKEIIRDYSEIIQPKIVKIEGKSEIKQVSFSELITIWSSDELHTKYKAFIDKIQQITFIGEVGNRLRWSSLINETSNRPDEIVFSRIKRKAQKDGIEILGGDIIKIAISPDKNHISILLNENAKDGGNKSSYNIHIINLKTGFVEKSYNSVVPNKGTDGRTNRDFDLLFLSNIGSNSEYNIYLTDSQTNFYLFGSTKEGIDNKKIFSVKDNPLNGETDKGIDITEGKDITTSKIDNSGTYLFRFHNIFSRISDSVNNSYKDKPHYGNLKDVGIKQSEIRTYLSITGLEESHVLLNGEKKSHIFPLTLKEDYLMPFLQQDNSLFMSNDGKYLFILFESEKNGNKIFIYQTNNDKGEIELTCEELNYSDLGINSKIKQIKFTKDNKKAFILQYEGDITIFDIANKKVLLKIKASFIKKAVSKSPDFKILRIALDPIGEYVSIYTKEDGKPQIVLLSLKTGKIAPLNLEGKNKANKGSLEGCTISPVGSNLKLIYNSKGTIFKLDFKGVINREVDITNIFDKITTYRAKREAAKNSVGRKNLERYEEIFNEKIGNYILKLNYDHVTKHMQYSFGQNQGGTFNLKFILGDILNARGNNSDNKGGINHLCFSKDGGELLYGTTDGQYCIYSRTKFIKLFEIEKQEQQTS